MHGSGGKLAPLLVVERLKRSGDYEAVGGAAYLGRLADAVPNAARARYYAEHVQDAAIRRGLIDMGILSRERSFGTEPGRIAMQRTAVTPLVAARPKESNLGDASPPRDGE